MTEVGFPPGTFAGVAAFYSIIHVPRSEQGPLLGRVGCWLCPGNVFVAAFGVLDVPGAYEQDWLAARMFWSAYDAETGRGLVEKAGLWVEHAVVETAEEGGEPASFLRVAARKPPGPATGRPAGTSSRDCMPLSVAAVRRPQVMRIVGRFRRE